LSATATLFNQNSNACILALESTCDETAAAIIRHDGVVLGNAIATQELQHADYQGVVPEIAARAHLENFLPVLRSTFKQANISIDDLVAVAVATQPGLPGSLLVGLATAKGLCIGWNKPLLGINHLHAHIYACSMQQPQNIFPCVGLIVSGGHTHLYRCESASKWQLLGSTIDDAAGEAFDKVAAMLGLPFPGGPHLSKLATHGDPTKYTFPRPLKNDRSTMNFSFSGLKTAVRYVISGGAGREPDSSKLTESEKSDIAASFEAAVIDCIVAKCKLAMRQSALPRMCVGGGVAANKRLREALNDMAKALQIELIIANPDLCTDNAVMGAIAWERARENDFDSLDLDVVPGLVRS
jgi:N6-L-threonylcarbamoyladenine synthase